MTVTLLTARNLPQVFLPRFLFCCLVVMAALAAARSLPAAPPPTPSLDAVPYRHGRSVSGESSPVDDWVLEGDESDAVYEDGYEMGGDEDAVYRDGIRDGGEALAVFENSLPDGARVLQPGDVVAPDDELEGTRVVPGADKFEPGGTEPGEYDGTRETGPEIWRMKAFLAKGGKKFRFIGDRVFTAEVKVIRHKEPVWKWGSHTTEKVEHEVKWRKVRVGERVIRKRVGRKLIARKIGYRIIKKMKKDPSDPDAPPRMMSVNCPVYKRYLVPEYQRWKVPVFRWEKVKVSHYHRRSFLTWIKRYRWVRRTYIDWVYWGSFDDFVRKYPAYAAAARRARTVTDRVMEERRALMSSVKAPSFDTFLQATKPKADPKEEFFLRQKKASVKPGVRHFVEHGVPESELVTIPPARVVH